MVSLVWWINGERKLKNNMQFPKPTESLLFQFSKVELIIHP